MRNLERQIALFGREGQERLRNTKVAIVGIGGLGTHVVQQLAYLGIENFALIDHEDLADTNLNRYVGAKFDDPIPGTSKVSIGERLIGYVEENPAISPLPIKLQTKKALDAIISADVTFGCVDKESVRFILNHFCVAFGKRLIDCGTGVDGEGLSLRYGGQVFIMWELPGCMVCCGKLDMREVREELASHADRTNREAIYGVDASLLAGTGPSVVSLNGVIASIAVTEFMVGVTGLRRPNRAFTYWAHTGKTSLGAPMPRDDCYTCSLWGKGWAADPQQYIE